MSAIGLDVGSTTVKRVVIDGAEVVSSVCVRHAGRPREVVRDLLAEVRRAHPRLPTGVTGSIGVAMAAELDARPVHEVPAVALAVRTLHPATASAVELGGQDAKVLFLDRAGDTEMNDRCAAGTGATIDRIAARLGLDEAELARARLEGDLRVAAKCGVFAETDCVNLVERGASPRAVLSALARAIVVQNLAVLGRGRVPPAPVLLLGGPHAHLPVLAEAWREALGRAWGERGVAPGPVEVPAHAELFAAIGAAAHAARGGRRLPIVTGVRAGSREGPALFGPGRDRAALGPLTAHEAPASLEAGPLAVHVGIDAGSTTSKLVALDAEDRVRFASYAPSRANPVDDARARLAELEEAARRAGARLEIVGLGTTGYGGELVAAALGADLVRVETLAHAAAATAAMPDVDAIVDVGGTDVKVVRVEQGEVKRFTLSTQCSAGHGAFLAQAAASAGIPLTEYAERALRAKRLPRFTIGCAVFMDTDRVTFLRSGFDPDEILAGLAWALPRNVWEYVVGESPARWGRRFLLMGGAHRNLAAAWAHAEYLREHVEGAQIAVHPRPELGGAIGVALEVGRARRSPTRFVGLPAARAVEVHTRTDESTRCGRCDLGCARSLVTVRAEGRARALVVGNACERGASAEDGVERRRGRGHAANGMAYEVARLFRPPPASARARADAPRIGIPRVMCLYRSAPLFLGYLAAAGVPPEHLVLSHPTSAARFHEGATAGVNDPCFPAKLVRSHVRELLREPIDLLFLPTLTHAKIAVHGTADTASCPIVAASGHTALAALRRDPEALSRRGVHVLTPELTLTDPERLDAQLFEAFGEVLGIDEDVHRRALEAGLAAQRRFHEDCQRFGRRTLRLARAARRAVAMILARPYHGDPGVEHGISTELAARGIPVLTIATLPADDAALLDLSELLPEVTNSGCAEQTWAARVIRADPALCPVHLSSFRCGQDASIAGTLATLLDELDRPSLSMQDLDEDRPGLSFGVRLETFAHAVRHYEARR